MKLERQTYLMKVILRNLNNKFARNDLKKRRHKFTGEISLIFSL